MLKSIVLAAALVAAPAWAGDWDDLPMTIAEAAFITARPNALGENGWYMYAPEPESKREFGFPVRGYLRGFEKGQGCAAAVGFWKTSVADTEKLNQAIEASLAEQMMVKTDMVEEKMSRFSYWEGPSTYASVNRLEKGSDQFAISVQVALKTCPDSADKFRTRPQAASADR